jgi:hypothetical protein
VLGHVLAPHPVDPAGLILKTGSTWYEPTWLGREAASGQVVVYGVVMAQAAAVGAPA